MQLTLHFSTPPIPDTYEHKKHLVEQFFKQKGIPTEPVNITTKGKREVNHAYVRDVMQYWTRP